MVEFPVRLKIKIRRLINRCPRRFRFFFGPLMGGLIGLIGGIFGFFIGLLLGYLLRELFRQLFRDRKILEYYENPGAQHFYEGEPGLAAWCALSVLITSQSSASSSDDRILKQVILTTSCVFAGPLAEPYLVDHFSRLALQKLNSLNPDLLAESFASRRAPFGDAGNLSRFLSSLADGAKAKNLIREIRLILDPALANEQDSGTNGKDPRDPKDPWKILGLTPGTPLKEIKAHYRRLAKQFHPDELEVLNEKQKETAARAFVAIKEAYEEITGA